MSARVYGYAWRHIKRWAMIFTVIVANPLCCQVKGYLLSPDCGTAAGAAGGSCAPVHRLWISVLCMDYCISAGGSRRRQRCLGGIQCCSLKTRALRRHLPFRTGAPHVRDRQPQGQMHHDGSIRRGERHASRLHPRAAVNPALLPAVCRRLYSIFTSMYDNKPGRETQEWISTESHAIGRPTRLPEG